MPRWVLLDHRIQCEQTAAYSIEYCQKLVVAVKRTGKVYIRNYRKSRCWADVRPPNTQSFGLFSFNCITPKFIKIRTITTSEVKLWNSVKSKLVL